MAKVLTCGGNVKIGAYMFPDRKKPCLCVQKDNEVTVYGTFRDIESADMFMNELGKMLGAIFEKKED